MSSDIVESNDDVHLDINEDLSEHEYSKEANSPFRMRIKVAIILLVTLSALLIIAILIFQSTNVRGPTGEDEKRSKDVVQKVTIAAKVTTAISGFVRTNKAVVWAVAAITLLAAIATLVWYFTFENNNETLIEENLGVEGENNVDTVDTLAPENVLVVKKTSWIEWFLERRLITQILMVILITFVIRISCLLGSFGMMYIYGMRSAKVTSADVSLDKNGLHLCLEAGFVDSPWMQFIHLDTLEDTTVTVVLPKLHPTDSFAKVTVPKFQFSKASSMVNFSKNPISIKVIETIDLQKFYENLLTETDNLQSLRGYKFPIIVYLNGDILSNMLPLPIRIRGAKIILKHEVVVEPTEGATAGSQSSPTSGLLQRLSITNDRVKVSANAELDLTKLPVPVPINIGSDLPLVKVLLDSINNEGTKERISEISITVKANNGQVKGSLNAVIGDGTSLEGLLKFLRQGDVLDIGVSILNSNVKLNVKLSDLVPQIQNAQKSLKVEKSTITTELTAEETITTKKLAGLSLNYDDKGNMIATLKIDQQRLKALLPFFDVKDIGIWPNFAISVFDDIKNSDVFSVQVTTDISNTEHVEIRAAINVSKHYIEENISSIVNRFIGKGQSGPSDELKICMAKDETKKATNDLFQIILDSLKLCVSANKDEKDVRLTLNDNPLPKFDQFSFESPTENIVLLKTAASHSLYIEAGKKDSKYRISSVLHAAPWPLLSGNYIACDWPEVNLGLKLTVGGDITEIVSAKLHKGRINQLLIPDIDPIALLFDNESPTAKTDSVPNANLELTLHNSTGKIIHIVKSLLERMAKSVDKKELADELEPIEEVFALINIGSYDLKLPIEQILKYLISIKKTDTIKEKIEIIDTVQHPIIGLSFLQLEYVVQPILRFFDSEKEAYDWKFDTDIGIPEMSASASIRSHKYKKQLAGVSLNIPKATVHAVLGKGGHLKVDNVEINKVSKKIDKDAYLPFYILPTIDVDETILYGDLKEIQPDLRASINIFDQESILPLEEIKESIEKLFPESDLANKSRMSGFLDLLNSKDLETDTLSGNLILDSSANSFSAKIKIANAKGKNASSAVMIRQDNLKMTFSDAAIPENSCSIELNNLLIPLRLGAYQRKAVNAVNLDVDLSCKFKSQFDSRSVRKYIADSVRDFGEKAPKIQISSSKDTSKTITTKDVFGFFNNNFSILSKLRIINPASLSSKVLETKDAGAKNVVVEKENEKAKISSPSITIDAINLKSATLACPIPWLCDSTITGVQDIMTLTTSIKHESLPLDVIGILSGLPFPQLFGAIDFKMELGTSISLDLTLIPFVEPIAQVSIGKSQFNLSADYTKPTVASVNGSVSVSIGVDLAADGLKSLLSPIKLKDSRLQNLLFSESQVLPGPSTPGEPSQKGIRTYDHSVPAFNPIIARVGSQSFGDKGNALSSVIGGFFVDVFVNDWLNLQARRVADYKNENLASAVPRITLFKDTIDGAEFLVNVPLKAPLPITWKPDISFSLELEDSQNNSEEIFGVGIKDGTSINPLSKEIEIVARLGKPALITSLVKSLLQGHPIKPTLKIVQARFIKGDTISLPLHVNLNQPIVPLALEYIAKEESLPPISRLEAHSGLISAGPEPKGDLPIFARIDVSVFNSKIEIYFGIKQSLLSPIASFNLYLIGGKIGVDKVELNVSYNAELPQPVRLIREKWENPKKSEKSIVDWIAKILNKEDEKVLIQLSDDEGFSQNYKQEFLVAKVPNIFDLKDLISRISNRSKNGGECLRIKDNSMVSVRIGNNWNLNLDLSRAIIPIRADWYSDPYRLFKIPDTSKFVIGDPAKLVPGTNWTISLGPTADRVKFRFALQNKTAETMTLELKEALAVKVDGNDYMISGKKIMREHFMKPPGPTTYNIRYSAIEKKLRIYSFNNDQLSKRLTPHYIEFPFDFERLFLGQLYAVSSFVGLIFVTDPAVNDVKIAPVDFAKTEVYYDSNYPNVDSIVPNTRAVFFVLKNTLEETAIIDDLYVKVLSANNQEIEAEYSLDRKNGVYMVRLPGQLHGDYKIELSNNSTDWVAVPKTIFFPTLM